jgi:Zn-finger protein
MPHYACFTNRDCEYFPCHAGADPEAFNCLFCYCPLYTLADRCGGDFVFLPNGVKDCSGCLFPHDPENYDRVLACWGDLAEVCRRELARTKEEMP